MSLSLDSGIKFLDLSYRAHYSLLNNTPTIDTIGKLVNMSAKELLNIRNLGKGSLKEVKMALLSAGFALRGENGPKQKPASCNSCRYWAWRVDPEDGEQEDKDKIVFAECRRCAPVLLHSNDDTAAWPQTRTKDWCGEYKAE